MTFRRMAIISLLALAPLAAQEADSSTNDMAAAWLRLPVWSPPTTRQNTNASFDTLRLNLAFPEISERKAIRRRRLASLSMAVLGAVLSSYYQSESDEAYSAYQRSGDVVELERLFRKSRRLDRYAGWSYVAAETGLVWLSVSFILDP